MNSPPLTAQTHGRNRSALSLCAAYRLGVRPAQGDIAVDPQILHSKLWKAGLAVKSLRPNSFSSGRFGQAVQHFCVFCLSALTKTVNRIEINPIFCVARDIREQGQSFHLSGTVPDFETEEGLDYVGTHGFSKTLCLHMRRGTDRRGCDASRRSTGKGPSV